MPSSDRVKLMRQAIIISSNTYNQQKPDLIIMAITSQISSSLTFGELQVIDFLSAGLIKPSVVGVSKN